MSAATALQQAHGAVAGWLSYVPSDEFPRALAALDAFVAEWEKLLGDAATVIERMANGASRPECSPELDRVIAALRDPVFDVALAATGDWARSAIEPTHGWCFHCSKVAGEWVKCEAESHG